MENLKFFNSLDKEQKDNAALVAKAAQEAGVDPTFAVAIAYKEGGLRTNAPRGSSGEVGMMQVMPTTGKGMGYVNKDLFDPQKNIEAGVKYLKKGLDSTGNDPRLAAIYYNGGPGAVEALKSGKDPDARVFTYIKSLNSYGTFNDYHGQEPAAPKVTDASLVTLPITDEEKKEAEDKANMPDTSNASPGERMLFGGAGAAAGALATGVDTLTERSNRNKIKIAGMEENARINAQREQGVIPPKGGAAVTPPVTQQAQANPPGALTRFLAPQGVQDAGYMAKGQTNVENYNKAKALGLTDVEASRALSQSKQTGGAYDLNARRVAGLNTIQERFPNQFQENPVTGIMTPTGASKADPTKATNWVYREPAPGQPVERQELPPRQGIPQSMLEPKSSTGLDYVSGLFRSMLRPIAPVARVLAPAVTTIGSRMLPPAAGLLTGVSAADLIHEYDKPPEQRDPIKMGLKGTSVLGGGLSMLGQPRVGVPLMAAGEGIQYLRENPKVITDTMDQISTNVVDPAKEFLLRQAEKLAPGANTQYSIYPPAP
jgi:hypothetical protein